MSTIPISLTEKQFEEHVSPFLGKAKRGFVCNQYFEPLPGKEWWRGKGG